MCFLSVHLYGAKQAVMSIRWRDRKSQRQSPYRYLTVCPQGDAEPLVSTLNNLTATIVANAAIVSAGASGGIAVYPDQDTDILRPTRHPS
jgi:hypothetical protein